MKTKLRIVGVLIGLCSAVATTAVFGQSTYVRTNQNPAHLTTGDLDAATNWSPTVSPGRILRTASPSATKCSSTVKRQAL